LEYAFLDGLVSSVTAISCVEKQHMRHCILLLDLQAR
jgi:hypothetical protein